MRVIDVAKLSSDQDEIENKSLIDKKYKYWRFRIFYGMYIGYAFYYFTRKSFTFAMPAMIANLGFDKGDLGIIGSVLSIAYGLSKFLSGIMSDKTNPRYFMGIGLIITGIFNICFGLSSTILFFALFWGLNGWFQGWGWPPCAKLLSHWYSQKERGRWWAMWSTSHNVGGALIPFVAAFAVQSFGWRYAMYLPGVMCIIVGFFLINRLRGTPKSLGLPPVEQYKRAENSQGEKNEKVDLVEEEKELTTKQILFDFVLKNRYIWILACSYFFVYMIRTALNDWGQLYLIESKGYGLFSAGSTVFWFEIGGFFGCLSAGFFSDKIFKGRRGPVNALFCIGVIGAIYGLWVTPPGQLVMASVMMFLIGFLIFGPQMLIGIAAAELSHKKAAGTATGFIGWFAYLGAATAGYPLGKVAQEFGWYGFFIIMGICGVVAVSLLIPLWSVKSNPKHA